MKRAKKGFTLIELLIVISVIGALAAVMGTSTDKATAQAKAASIVSNIAACKNAAAMYYADNLNKNLSEKTASEFLTTEYIPSWSDFGGDNTEGTTYKAGEGQGFAEWNLVVDFSKDGDATGITKALQNIRGYTGVTGTSFTVTLASGKINGGSGTGGGTTDPETPDPENP